MKMDDAYKPPSWGCGTLKSLCNAFNWRAWSDPINHRPSLQELEERAKKRRPYVKREPLPCIKQKGTA